MSGWARQNKEQMTDRQCRRERMSTVAARIRRVVGKVLGPALSCDKCKLERETHMQPASQPGLPSPRHALRPRFLSPSSPHHTLLPKHRTAGRSRFRDTTARPFRAQKRWRDWGPRPKRLGGTPFERSLATLAARELIDLMLLPNSDWDTQSL